MRSNTEGWSNTKLNDRVVELEDKLEAVRMWKYRMYVGMPFMGRGYISMSDLGRLGKILGDSEFTTNHDKEEGK